MNPSVMTHRAGTFALPTALSDRWFRKFALPVVGLPAGTHSPVLLTLPVHIYLSTSPGLGTGVPADLWLNGLGLGSGTVLDSLRVSKNVDLPQERFWIRVDYPKWTFQNRT
ncbi:hypothetical protein Bbelb_340260 [Branchiostoma belcheri]|nr:hypothetical protein Bbelb_340260 [Branchiostoma belcheri]